MHTRPAHSYRHAPDRDRSAFTGAGAVAAVTAAVVVAAASWRGVRRQRRDRELQLDRLRSAAAVGSGETSSTGAHHLDALPEPVARYLAWAMPTDQPIDEVQMTQAGMIRTGVSSRRWLPFDAEHVVRPAAAGFVWNARIALAPFAHVRVTDALVSGRGSGRVALLSAFTLQEDAGTPEMNAGSLHRFLAEAVWYPTALRPSAHLQWTAIDDNRALATLTAHDVAVSLEFRFAPTGEVTGIYTPARWGTFAEGYRQAGWEGHFRDYELRSGMRIPSYGEVGWYVGDVWQPVWKGRITGYHVARTSSVAGEDPVAPRADPRRPSGRALPPAAGGILRSPRKRVDHRGFATVAAAAAAWRGGPS